MLQPRAQQSQVQTLPVLIDELKKDSGLLHEKIGLLGDCLNVSFGQYIEPQDEEQSEKDESESERDISPNSQTYLPKWQFKAHKH